MAKSLQHEGETFYFVLVGFFWSCNLSKVKPKSRIFHVFCISPPIILSSNCLDVSFNCPGHISFPHIDLFFFSELNLYHIFFPLSNSWNTFFLLPAATEFLSFSDFTYGLATLLYERNNKPLPLDPIWSLDS